jgi:hypothetical protein
MSSMSEKIKPTKIPLSVRLRSFLDRLRASKPETDLARLDRLVSQVRKEITDLTIEWKFGGSLFSEGRAMAELHRSEGIDLGEMRTDAKLRMAQIKEQLQTLSDEHNRLMEERQKILDDVGRGGGSEKGATQIQDNQKKSKTEYYN